jgi:hypothetical protein
MRKSGVQHTIKGPRNLSISFVPPSASQNTLVFPQGRFDFDRFVQELRARELPHTAPDFSISTHSEHIVPTSLSSRRGVALVFDPEGIGSTLLRQYSAVTDALHAAGSTYQSKSGFVPRLPFMFADDSVKSTIPQGERREMDTITRSALQDAYPIELRFGPVVIGPYPDEPLPGTTRGDIPR